jgi:hypothetical protein
MAKILPHCGHTACLKCIKNLFDPQTLTCPVCKAKTLTDKPPEALATNDKVMRMVDLLAAMQQIEGKGGSKFY